MQCLFFKRTYDGETINSISAPGFWEAAEDNPNVSVDRKALTWQKKKEKNLKAVDRHWERIWHRELSHDGVNYLLASLSAPQPATWGHLQGLDHCQAVKIFCCNSVLTLLLPRFGLVASAAAVLGRWCSPHSGWSQTLLHNTNLPLGGAIKSRQAAVAIRLCLSIGRSPTSQKQKMGRYRQ